MAVVTPIGTLCFVNVFKARGNNQNPAQAPRFSTLLLLDKNATQTPAYAELRKAVQGAAAEKWGAAKAQDANFMRSLRLPFRNASEKDYAGFDKGEIYLSAWSAAERKPGVVDIHNKPIEIPDQVYSGQLGRLFVNPFAYDSNGNRGVSFGLSAVQIVKADAPRLDGSIDATRAFDGVDNSEFASYGIDPSAVAQSTTATQSGGDMPW